MSEFRHIGKPGPFRPCSGWFRLRLAWLGFALIGTATGRAEELPTTPAAAKPLVVLFVGNSFCHGRFLPLRRYNAVAIEDENFGLPPTEPRAERGESGPYGGIPGIFKKFTDESGARYDVHLEAVSATSLEFHYQHALAVIVQARWDVVVLQDYSTGPLPAARGGKPERFRKNATLLEQAIHAVNPGCRVYLYETWPRADLTFVEKTPYFGEPIDAMTRELHDGYYQEFAENGHFEGVAPVGDAWLRSIQCGIAQANPLLPEQKEKINLWGEDAYHPSVGGAYLAALVLFQQITGQDPRELGAKEQAAVDLGISADDVTKLQRVAAEQVSAGLETAATLRKPARGAGPSGEATRNNSAATPPSK